MIYVKKEHKDELKLSDFPNFHASGSIAGMKKNYYGENALLIRCGNFVYNVDKETYDKALTL